MLTRVITLLVVAAASVASVSAWGPMSHYFMTCYALQPAMPMERCATDPANLDLLLGTDAPDAFAGGTFVTGSPCDKYGALHNIEFASYQMKYALSLPPVKFGFDPVAYSLGFGAHIMGDHAGFIPGGFALPPGYLGNGHMPIGQFNYISLWSFMIAVDAEVMSNSSTPVAQLPKQPLSNAATEFIAKATSYYVEQTGKTFPVMTAAEVDSCTSEWSVVRQRILQTAAAYSKNTIKDLLVFYDNFGATTFEEAYMHMAMALDCGVSSISKWADLIKDPSVSAEDAMNEALAYLGGLYQDGMCTPSNQPVLA